MSETCFSEVLFSALSLVQVGAAEENVLRSPGSWRLVSQRGKDWSVTGRVAMTTMHTSFIYSHALRHDAWPAPDNDRWEYSFLWYLISVMSVSDSAPPGRVQANEHELNGTLRHFEWHFEVANEGEILGRLLLLLWGSDINFWSDKTSTWCHFSNWWFLESLHFCFSH